VSKVVTGLMRSSMRSPLGLVLLVRYTQSLLATDANPATQKALTDFRESCMRHKSEMVILEAARAVCSLPAVSSRDLGPAITMLHMFLASPKPALRFAAVRTLHALAAEHAAVVAKCNDDLEALITDANRSIATLAITTLLKTGSEASVDRLAKQIGSFMVDVGSDELKIVVVRGIHELGMDGCMAVTDAGLDHLHGINKLWISGCTAVTDAGLAHLTGIHTLGMWRCPGITDAGLVHLRGIRVLYIKGPRLTAAALAQLEGADIRRS
jgi:hypothetical protein